MFLASTCSVCGASGPSPCATCTAQLRPAPPLPPPPGVDRCLALLEYEGTGRELVARLKYRNQRVALRGLASAMATLVDPLDHHLVTWMPTTAQRRRSRGFDQAELLARAVAKDVGLKWHRLLHRGVGPPQTGGSLADRLRGPKFRADSVPTGARVLLVDDVITSGATAAMAAAALRVAGAERVTVLAAARTPLKPRSVLSDTSRDASQ